MDYNITSEYLDLLINKVFAILGVYEDCEITGDFEGYYTYLDRVITELNGCSQLFNSPSFMSMASILTGINHSDNINHRKIKSLVFHCISIIKKIKNDEVVM